MAKKRINPYKESLYIRFGKSPVDELWKTAMSLARQFIGGRKNILHEKYSSIASYLVAEKIQEKKFGEKSFYSRYEKATGTKTEKFREALRGEYSDRTFTFRDENGFINVKFNGETKTLEEWFNLFEEEKISKDTMNDIIKLAKETNEYTSKEIYNGTTQNEDTSNNLVKTPF